MYTIEYVVTVNVEGNGTASASPAHGATGTEVDLTAKPATGWELKEWRVDSGGVTVEGDSFIIGTDDVTITAVFTAEPGYYCFDGSDATWQKGSNAPLAFTFKRAVEDDTTFEHFVGIEVDGASVPEKDASGAVNYTYASGSVVIALQPAYLEALSTGDHAIAAVFDDGEAQAPFTVTSQPEPSPAPEPQPGTDEPQPGADDPQPKPAEPADSSAKPSAATKPAESADNTAKPSASTKSASSNAAKTGDPLTALPAVAVALALVAAGCLAATAYAQRRNSGDSSAR